MTFEPPRPRTVGPGGIGVCSLPMRDALDSGPSFHGTKADLRPGDQLTAGFRSNYRPEIVMNHVYFTALENGAGLAAELAAGDAAPRAYEVEPTGDFENDPNADARRLSRRCGHRVSVAA